MAQAPSSLQDTLRRARRGRRISQLELALELGVSQRHVSFVESGRSRPSRELLIGWLQVLEAPLALSNEALLAAGYAPAYSERHLEDPWLAEADHALEQLLRAHEPTPALVLDAEWTLVRMNGGARWLATTLMPAAAELLGQGPVNMLDLLTHPEGLSRHVSNLSDVGPRFLALLRREVAAHPSLLPRVEAYEADLLARLGTTAGPGSRSGPQAPVLTTRFRSPHGELAFFSMFTTFGTPNDITLASLRVEHMFPADEATRAVLQRMASHQRSASLQSVLGEAWMGFPFPHGVTSYLSGGVLVGLGLMVMYLTLGVKAGASSFLSSTLTYVTPLTAERSSRQWRLQFAIATALGAWLYAATHQDFFVTAVEWWRLALGGLLVGFGTRLSSA